VTLEALAPFRCAAFPRATGDPKPLSYLWDDEDQREGGFDIQVEMHLKTRNMRSPVRLSRASFRDSYWTVAQLVAHHTSNGCNLRPGDLLGSGTISGATPDSYGSMMELTQGGKHPVELPGGERRAFLEDGDEAVQKGYCENGTHVRIGFGEAAGAIRP
jgi:fumarylacetoacetase